MSISSTQHVHPHEQRQARPVVSLHAILQATGLAKKRNILHVSARQQVRSLEAGSNDPASHHQFATIMFVCGHPRHNVNAQGIIGHISLDIKMLMKFMISKGLPSSLNCNIIVRGVHHASKSAIIAWAAGAINRLLYEGFTIRLTKSWIRTRDELLSRLCQGPVTHVRRLSSFFVR